MTGITQNKFKWNRGVNTLLLTQISISASRSTGWLASNRLKYFRNEVFLKIISVKHSKANYQSFVIMQGAAFLMNSMWVVRLPKKKSPTHVKASNIIFAFNIITYLEVVSGG
ncbi:hypothetical protein DW662_01620 [Streptococcus gallolyticus]|nr:hypothetical protein DW662_01620 [Streptococcus gallolyticus]